MARYIKCPSCGYIGKAKIVDWDLGGCLIAIILLICFIVPGIIYIIWRDSKAAKLCCPQCGWINVVRISKTKATRNGGIKKKRNVNLVVKCLQILWKIIIKRKQS